MRPDTARRFHELISRHIVLDPHARARRGHAYTVRSIYFDSPTLECYWTKIGGQHFREKYRLRTYNEVGSAPLNFELKQKRGTDYWKFKIPVDGRVVTLDAASMVDWLPTTSAQREDDAGRQRVLFKLRRMAYRPSVLVTYDREAYVSRWDPTARITFDRHLRARPYPAMSSLHDESQWSYPLSEWVIVEVKFTRLVPRWMATVHGRLQLKTQACSKYCTAVAETVVYDGGVRWARHG